MESDKAAIMKRIVIFTDIHHFMVVAQMLKNDQYKFRSHPLVPMASMSDNELFTTIAGRSKDSNLVKGVWFNGDTSNFLMYREQPTHEDWLIALKFSLGFQYRTGEDVMYYKGV